MSVGKALAISFAIVMGIVVVSGACVYQYAHNLYNAVNYVEDDSIAIVEELPAEAFDDAEATGEDISDEELAAIQGEMENISLDTKSDEDIYNILLIGVDRQERTWNGNSDCMILVSINRAEDRITMVSLMRDTYVNIPEVGYAKLNAAYAYGAGPLLCQTITETYKIEVERYIAVDFWDLIDIIDIIGGVDLEVTEAEVEVANGYILDMCNRLLNLDPTDHYFDASGGLVHADGVQAVAYARNRYVGNSDFSRTERQRYVLLQTVEEIKKLSLTQMNEKLTAILPYITTNIPESEIWDLFSEVSDLLEYEIETSRVPYDNMYSSVTAGGQDVLVPYWEDTLTQLHEFIYGGGDSDE